MRITFIFDDAVNRECLERLVAAKQMFGKVFPTEATATSDEVRRAVSASRLFQKWWVDGDNCDDGLKTIYQHEPPEAIICYINTSGYSMDIHPRGAISLSMTRDTPQKVRTTIIHELSHLMFREYFTDYCISIGCSATDIEELKEVLTVLNNVVFDGVEDHGYQVHAVLRELALDVWQKTHDVRRVIQVVKQNFV